MRPKKRTIARGMDSGFPVFADRTRKRMMCAPAVWAVVLQKNTK